MVWLLFCFRSDVIAFTEEGKIIVINLYPANVECMVSC
jgi:hypothetical protein